MPLPITFIKPFNIFNKIFVRKDENKMIDIETSKPLDKALNFNQENFFEYMNILLHEYSGRDFTLKPDFGSNHSGITFQ